MPTYRLKTALPMILLGVPLAESENPFLAIPMGSIRMEVLVEDGGGPPSVNTGMPGLEALVHGFLDNILQVVGNVRVTANIEAGGGYSPASLYAAITAVIAHSIAKHFGDSLEPWEIVELARYADPIEKPSGWQYVLDALRYAVASGKPVVYRNDEEFATIEAAARPGIRYVRSIEPVVQRLGRDKVGPDPYNALVHLVGVTVLESVVRLQEGTSPIELIHTTGTLLQGVIEKTWNLPPAGEGCFYSPGLPGVMDVYCTEGA